MHPALCYESFFFCPRNDLERLQPLSQTLLDIIVAGSNLLPLRPIHRVEMLCDKTIQIFVEEDEEAFELGWCHLWPDYEASVHDGDFAETFRRLQHTCIKSVYVEIRDSPFLRYWKAQEAAAFTVVTIHVDPSETTDYDLLDSVVNHLRPRTTQVHVEDSNSYNREYLKVLTRDSFLNHLQTCGLRVHEDAFPPPSFVLDEPGYSNYELRCRSDVADGIDGFIESFVRDGCANSRLESVYVRWDDGEGSQSVAPKQLRKPTKSDVPLPKVDLTAWLTRDVLRVSQCEVHSFVNKKQRKLMEVYKWSVEYEEWDRRPTTHILQCRVKDL